MANDNHRTGEPARREPPLAAAARRLAEQRAREANAQATGTAATPPAAAPAAPAAEPAAPSAPAPAAASFPPPPPRPAEAAPEAASAPGAWQAPGWAPPESKYPPPPPSPSYRAVPGSYSPWWKRALAALVDGMIIWAPLGILGAATGAGGFETDPFTNEVTFSPNGAYWIVMLLSIVGPIVYYTLMEGGAGGATVGKLALGIHVRDESGMGPIGYGRALGRRLMAILFWWLLIIPGLLDVLSPLWDARRQTWHDKVVRSVVVDKG